MKVSSRIEGSTCGAILLNRHFSTSWSAARKLGRHDLRPCPQVRVLRLARSFSYHEIITTKLQGHRKRTGRSSDRRVRANSPGLRATGLHDGSFFRSFTPGSVFHEPNSAANDQVHDEEQIPPPPPPRPRTKEELLELVDHYDDDTVDEHLRFFRDPFLRRYAQPDGPNLSVSDRQHDVEYPTHEDVQRGDEEDQKTLWKLRFAVLSSLRNPYRASLDTVYKLYQRIPEPRMSYLTGRLRHQLLRVFGDVEKKDSKSMLRYFSVVADIKNNGLPLTATEWNCAISYAARYVGKSTEAEVESALKLWREMEQDAKVQATDVTFNILFDVASKSGNFTLAEMIYKEMESRGHVANRYHHVSLIHYFGLKGDSGGVRATYREMVHAGEIIDTVVLNCVIVSLLRCGEETSAEYVYERMKTSIIEASDSQSVKMQPLPARNYATNKAINRALAMFARLGRREPDLRPNFQSTSVLAPDLQTYRILMTHYGVQLGNLAKVAQFLDEMKFFQIPVHGAVFLALFKGFASHGGYAGSPWSERRLDGIWEAFLQALERSAEATTPNPWTEESMTDEESETDPDAFPRSGDPRGPRAGAKPVRFDQLEIRSWMVVWALRAFQKCASRERMLEAYEDMRIRWKLDAADAQFAVDYLNKLLGEIRK